MPGNYYYYKFILDRKDWRYDPKVNLSCNQYGSYNNYIYVHSRPLSGRNSLLDTESIITKALT